MFNRRNFLKNSLFFASGLSLNPLAWGQSVEELNQIIANFIYQLRLEGRISADEKTAWAVSDISKGQFLAKINAENILLEDVLLGSPTAALRFVTGHKLSNGPGSWKNSSGISLYEILQSEK